jgi:5-methylthioadenosine/S-adenosylhomocysteine deaminase
MSQISLLCNATVVTMARDRRIITDGAVAYRGDRIIGVGKTDDLISRFPSAVRRPLNGALVTPGLIDAHNHPAHFLTKGLLDDCETGLRWRTRLYPFESSVQEEEVYWGSLGTFAEMLLHGTTCVSEPGCYQPIGIARAVEKSGIRGLMTGVVTDSLDINRPFAENIRPSAKVACEMNERLYEQFNGSADGRLRVAFALWSNNSVSDDLARLIVAAAERRGAVIHGHLSTRESDNELSVKTYGLRSVDRYRNLGVLQSRFVGAHAGAINDSDVDAIAAAGASIVHCPTASMFGAFGCISRGRFPELIEAGVPIAIGSDAASISRFLDMPRIMYIAACAHKDIRMNAEVIGAHRAMEMATVNGARALGMQDEIGSLEEGKQADIAVFRTDGIEWQPRPLYNPVANLVYSSGGYRAETVVVAGRTLVDGGKLLHLDIHELMERTAAASASATARIDLHETPVWPVF